jgi:hypothetical protein
MTDQTGETAPAATDPRRSSDGDRTPGDQSDRPIEPDSLFAALTAGAADRPESRVLDGLVGDWRVTTRWEPIVGHGVQEHRSESRNRWILRGRVLECRNTDPAGEETARLQLAFDPSVGDYAAFSTTVLSTFFIVERGGYDPATRSLAVDGIEPIRREPFSVRYRRTIEFVSDDLHRSTISYPGAPAGRYGPLSATFERLA